MAIAVYTTGRNNEYNLGLGDNTDRDQFAEVGHDFTIVRLSPYESQKFGVGIKSDGTLWGWGDNTYKQLGLSGSSYTTPTQIGSDSDWADVALGDWFMLARKTNGKIYACGRNTLGQCATGNTTSPVSTLTQIGSATDWASIAAGPDNGYAIKTSGALYAWGLNDAGQVGKGTTGGSQTSPVQEATASTLWTAVAGGAQFAIARRSNGTLWGWGDYYWGANGLGGSSADEPTQIGSATTWSQIAAGRYHAHAIRTDGTLWGWGTGYAKGDGSSGTQYAPVQIGSATDWLRVAAGFGHMVALKSGYTLYGVGENGYGQLGLNNTTSPVTSLTQITGLPVTPTAIGAGGNGSLISAPYTAPSYIISGPITVTVNSSSGSASAPITVQVRDEGPASCPLRIAVVDSLDTRIWSASVSLDGVDVSARVVGVIEVDAEEGASRIASFSLIPATGSINPIAWTGSSVAIDLLRQIGAVSVPTRLFTGRVDVATYDPVRREVLFACADDLHNTVSALTTEQIDSLTEGRHSIAVQGTQDDKWDYAQARMETRAASLDASATGGLRVTDWAAGTPWRSFGSDDILDATPAIELPRRRDLVNRVDIVYQYRYHRLRERQASITWSGTILGTAALASGYRFPDLDSITGAISGIGWTVQTSAYSSAYDYVKTGMPSGAPSGADDDWWIYGGGGVASYSATLAQRHAQTVTESYAITVAAPDSVSANGTLASSLRGALASTWTPNQWEADLTLEPDASAGDMDYAPDADRDDSDAAILTLIDMARARILGSHRHTRVSFSMPCLPELDLTHTVSVDTATMDAVGKVARLRHRLDPDAGEATTTVTIAVSGIAAGGSASDTPVAAPDVPDIDTETGSDDWEGGLPDLSTYVGGATISPEYADSMMGFLTNAPAVLSYYNFTLDVWYTAPNSYYSAADEFDTTGFRVSMPGVADSHRNPVSLSQSASYDVAIPEDALTLSA